MNRKPKCIIVTGRQGSGKTTISKKLGEQLWMPVINRDEIKEGYVSTCGVEHDKLPPDTNGLITDLFFEIVNQYLAGKISIVIEAAFQHKVWEWRMQKILELSSPVIVLCTGDIEVAARRQIQRGLENPERAFYHGDNRVVHYQKTGESLPPANYEVPNLNVPTIEVSTDGKYIPSLDDIIKQIQSSVARQTGELDDLAGGGDL